MTRRRGLVLGGIALLIVAGAFGASASAPAHTANNTTIAFVAEYPGESGQTNVTLATESDVAGVGDPQQTQGVGWRVPVTLTENGTNRFSETLVETGFLDDGIQQCRDADAGNRYCLVVYFEGEVIQTAGLGPRLAQVIDDGEFTGEFSVGAQNETQARRIAQALSERSESTGTTTTATPTPETQRDTTTVQTDGVTEESMTQTERVTTQTEESTTETVQETTPSGFGPGFTGLTTALALLSSLALLRRREA